MCWISVETQKPEFGAVVDVWVTDKYPKNKPRRVVDCEYLEAYPGAGRAYFYAYNITLESNGLTVTHWRYPPAPPEGNKA